MLQFPGFALSHESTGSSIQWVAPFRNARIKTCLQFPEPFRSLPRLSSPPDSLGILRSLFVPFSDFVPPFSQSLRQMAFSGPHNNKVAPVLENPLP